MPDHADDAASSVEPAINVVAKLLDPPDRRSIGRAEEVVADVLADPGLFEAVFAAVVDEPVVRMRAANVVEKVARQRPELVAPHTEALLTTVAAVEQHEVGWHVAQLLGRPPLTPRDGRRAVEVLLGYLAENSSIVKTCAMQALADLAREDEDVRAQVVPLLDELTRTGTPAMRARGRKLLAGLTGTAPGRRPSSGG